MKKIFVLFLFATLVASAQDLNKLDNENGFRGKKFGVPLSTFKNMLFLTGMGEVKVFMDRSEDLWMGNGTAKKITYEFYKEKFYKVNIEVQGFNNISGVFDYLKERFGSPVKLGGSRGQSYRWQGNKVSADYKEITNGAKIEIVSKEFESRMDRDRDRAQQ